MGSASQLAVISRATPPSQSCDTPRLSLPASVMRVPYFNGDTLLTAASLTGGNSISTLVGALESWMRELDVPPPSKDTIYDKLLALAEKKIDTKLRVGVTLWGERHDPQSTGSAECITANGITLGDISAATMRGVAENLYRMMPEQVLQDLRVRCRNFFANRLRNHGTNKLSMFCR